MCWKKSRAISAVVRFLSTSDSCRLIFWFKSREKALQPRLRKANKPQLSSRSKEATKRFQASACSWWRQSRSWKKTRVKMTKRTCLPKLIDVYATMKSQMKLLNSFKSFKPSKISNLSWRRTTLRLCPITKRTHPSSKVLRTLLTSLKNKVSKKSLKLWATSAQSKAQKWPQMNAKISIFTQLKKRVTRRL